MYMSKRAVQQKVKSAKDKLKLKYGDALPMEISEIFSLLKLLTEHRIEIRS